MAGGRRGRNEAYPTGACGRQTFSGGWRSYEIRQLTRGCRTFWAHSSIGSKPGYDSLKLRSEEEERQSADEIKESDDG